MFSLASAELVESVGCTVAGAMQVEVRTACCFEFSAALEIGHGVSALIHSSLRENVEFVLESVVIASKDEQLVLYHTL